MHPEIEKLQLNQFKDYLKPRQRAAHKGDFGHVLVVGGDYGFSGAVRLAAEAALRVGAGLVSVATRPEHALTLNVMRPEMMCHGIRTMKEFQALCKKATVIVIGTGMGRSAWAKQLLAASIKTKKPLVVDADALNLLAEKPTHYPNWILTPHPGEAARLLKTTTDEVQHDRVTAIRKLQNKYAGVCILKGAGSLVLGPNSTITMCDQGNPGMASGGMGDVLSGVIGGLVAQHIPLDIAAQLGVVVHAAAGDLAARDGERGMLALDLMPYLRKLVN